MPGLLDSKDALRGDHGTAYPFKDVYEDLTVFDVDSDPARVLELLRGGNDLKISKSEKACDSFTPASPAAESAGGTGTGMNAAVKELRIPSKNAATTATFEERGGKGRGGKEGEEKEKEGEEKTHPSPHILNGRIHPPPRL